MKKSILVLTVIMAAVNLLFAQDLGVQSGKKISMKTGSFTDKSAGDVLKNLNNGTAFSFGK